MPSTSNLLPRVCSLFSLSSQVRVHGLQELVYKQGQSRVNRASVTIVFDNRQTSKSPIGYESCSEITVTRQVVIGGRNKYLINGHTAQLQRVQNLFHSVGLNVNNPHFLIMQGRITKVCNMKPLETLGMIEEAAGTKSAQETRRMQDDSERDTGCANSPAPCLSHPHFLFPSSLFSLSCSRLALAGCSSRRSRRLRRRS